MSATCASLNPFAATDGAAAAGGTSEMSDSISRGAVTSSTLGVVDAAAGLSIAAIAALPDLAVTSGRALHAGEVKVAGAEVAFFGAEEIAGLEVAGKDAVAEEFPAPAAAVFANSFFGDHVGAFAEIVLPARAVELFAELPFPLELPRSARSSSSGARRPA